MEPVATNPKPDKIDFLIAGGVIIGVAVIVALIIFVPNFAEILGWIALAIVALGLAFAVLVVIVRDSRESLRDARGKKAGDNF